MGLPGANRKASVPAEYPYCKTTLQLLVEVLQYLAVPCCRTAIPHSSLLSYCNTLQFRVGVLQYLAVPCCRTAIPYSSVLSYCNTLQFRVVVMQYFTLQFLVGVLQYLAFRVVIHDAKATFIHGKFS